MMPFSTSATSRPAPSSLRPSSPLAA
ncbi:hypothetical protein SMACR_08634 [Sordaria macrospora]|uniref:Uncharacterized protein n=1 Tax=Sordaria macrospora TaxID=5147 RepID=A0A8S8ZHY2_SORMA|nr:hypothetical protein SMACR_08634 [Sordaria macrospora]